MRNFRHVSQFILVDNFVASSPPHAYIDKTLVVNSRTAGFHSHQAHFLKTQQPLGKEIKILLSLSPCWLGRFFGLNIDFTFFVTIKTRPVTWCFLANYAVLTQIKSLQVGLWNKCERFHLT